MITNEKLHNNNKTYKTGGVNDKYKQTGKNYHWLELFFGEKGSKLHQCILGEVVGMQIGLLASKIHLMSLRF